VQQNCCFIVLRLLFRRMSRKEQPTRHVLSGFISISGQKDNI